MTRVLSDQLDDPLLEVESELAPLVQTAAKRHAMRRDFIDELETKLAVFMSEERDVRRRRPLPTWRSTGWMHEWRWHAALAGGAAAAIVALTVLLYPRLTPEVDASALVAAVENATDSVPSGSVLHVVTTYRLSPPIDGLAAPTIEQWFGDINGHPAVRRTGLQGEAMIVDSSGTSWTFAPGRPQVVRVPPEASHFSPAAFNRATLDGILPGTPAQARVVGHTTINGRPATTLQLTGTLPTPQMPTQRAQSPATADPSPVPVIGVGTSSGFLFRTTSSAGGGTLISELEVDDASHEILKGRSVSVDPTGATVGTAEWSITTYELVPVSQTPANLFVVTPSADSQIVQPKPGEPMLISDHP